MNNRRLPTFWYHAFMSATLIKRRRKGSTAKGETPPLSAQSLDAVRLDAAQSYVFNDVSWSFYEKLLEEYEDRHLRSSYDNGQLEIMSPRPEHENVGGFLGRVIETISFELEIDCLSLGSTTFRRKRLRKGFEPDKCFFFNRSAEVMKYFDDWYTDTSPVPDLIIEIDYKSTSVPRQPIFAGIGIAEVWLWNATTLNILELKAGKYRKRERSLALPFFSAAYLTTLVHQSAIDGQLTVLRKMLAAAKRDKWTK